MPNFRIEPVDDKFAPVEISAYDASAVLNVVDQIDCKEAHVLQENAYLFSVRLSDFGMWSIFQHESYASCSVNG